MFIERWNYFSGAALVFIGMLPRIEMLPQAAARAVRTVVFLAAFSFTMVLPRSPHAPLEGAKTAGSDLT
jgi:hypothetical protein